MKFGHKLYTDVSERFRDHSLKYRELKEFLLKEETPLKLSEIMTAPLLSTGLSITLQQVIDLLDSELGRLDLFVQLELNALRSSLTGLHAAASSGFVGNELPLETFLDRLNESVVKLRELYLFCQLNITGFTKIAKKVEKKAAGYTRGYLDRVLHHSILSVTPWDDLLNDLMTFRKVACGPTPQSFPSPSACEPLLVVYRFSSPFLVKCDLLTLGFTPDSTRRKHKEFFFGSNESPKYRFAQYDFGTFENCSPVPKSVLTEAVAAGWYKGEKYVGKVESLETVWGAAGVMQEEVDYGMGGGEDCLLFLSEPIPSMTFGTDLYLAPGFTHWDELRRRAAQHERKVEPPVHAAVHAAFPETTTRREVTTQRHRPKASLVRVEPKSFFSNERLLIDWIHASLVLVTVAVASKSVFLLALCSLIQVVAIYNFYKRKGALRSKSPKGYSSIGLPVLIVIVVAVSVATCSS